MGNGISLGSPSSPSFKLNGDRHRQNLLLRQDDPRAEQNYGWSKFIVVAPSIAIREGVAQSMAAAAEHFLEAYGKKVRCFIYDSKALHILESFSSDAGINVIIINVQAFNAPGKDARRIYEELDDFQSRRPIDVIAANRPILILDEPQKMEPELPDAGVER
jgi:type III restriction enzyme